MTTGCVGSPRDFFRSKKDLNLKQVFLTWVHGKSEWESGRCSHTFVPGEKIHLFYRICHWSVNQKRNLRNGSLEPCHQGQLSVLKDLCLV